MDILKYVEAYNEGFVLSFQDSSIVCASDVAAASDEVSKSCEDCPAKLNCRALSGGNFEQFRRNYKALEVKKQAEALLSR